MSCVIDQAQCGSICMLVQFLIFWGFSILISVMAKSVCTHTCYVKRFPCPCNLAIICFLDNSVLTLMHWHFIVSLTYGSLIDLKIINTFFACLFLCFKTGFLLCSLDCSGICPVDRGGLKLMGHQHWHKILNIF